MVDMTRLTVGEVARMAGVSVRTLHHYDEIGLLRPSGRTPGGYRTYDDADVDRLRSILTYRELGLGLDEIAAAIDADTDRIGILRAARDRLSARIRRLEAVRESLDEAISGEQRGHAMTPEEKLSVFGDFDPDAHEEEARQRWGDTDAYAESARRAAAYTAADWEQIQAEAADIYGRFVTLMDAGASPGSDEARAVVEAHRRHISDAFYECSPEMHAGLGAMYVADERFTRTIDAHGEGLAAYMAAAISSAYGGRGA